MAISQMTISQEDVSLLCILLYPESTLRLSSNELIATRKCLPISTEMSTSTEVRSDDVFTLATLSKRRLWHKTRSSSFFQCVEECTELYVVLLYMHRRTLFVSKGLWERNSRMSFIFFN